MRRATVHDVAEAANASLATVDRVLNGRPGVSPAMAERVREAARRLCYRRDILAANLATSRQYRFTFVVPPPGTNGFFGALHEEIDRHAALLASRRVMVGRRVYAAFNEPELVECLDELVEEDCLGVAVVAIDGPRVRETIDKLVARGIAVVTLVSDALRSRRTHYVGIDNAAAGRTAASLLGRFVGRRDARVGIVLGSATLRDHAERQLGFCQVMARDFPDFEVLPALAGRDCSERTRNLVRDLLRQHPDLAGLYSIGGGNRGIIRALEESGRAGDIVTVAHELTAASRAALLAGTYDAVLHQDPGEEIEHALRILRATVDREDDIPPPVRTNIFVRDNLP